ncbi:hypothetical protein ACOSQ2_020463 [Xanthoceras sorbifolium]
MIFVRLTFELEFACEMEVFTLHVALVLAKGDHEIHLCSCKLSYRRRNEGSSICAVLASFCKVVFEKRVYKESEKLNSIFFSESNNVTRTNNNKNALATLELNIVFMGLEMATLREVGRRWNGS